MKKLLIIFSITILLFNSMNIKPVKANPLAIPAGIEVGAGVYVTGALVAGGLAAAVGYTEEGEQLRAHAEAVWLTANDVVKQSLRTSIQQAVALGTSTVQLGEDFLQWFKSAVATDLSDVIYGSTVLDQAYADAGYAFNWRGSSGFDIENGSFSMYQNGVRVKLASSLLVEKISCSQYGTCVWAKVGTYSTGVAAASSFPNAFKTDLSLSEAISIAQTIAAQTNYQIIAGAVTVPETPVDNYAEQVSRGLEPVFNHVKENGISIPLGNIGATTASGQPLTWDQDLGKWKLVDGVPYDPAIDGDIAWQAPTAEAVVNPDGTIALDDVTGLPQVKVKDITGTEIGTILTDYPLDGAGTENPPVTGEYGGILSNILAKIGTIVAVLTTGLIGDFSNLHWDKLKMAGEAFSTKFPFSLPWDVGRALDAIFGGFTTGNTPSWELEFSVLGNTYSWNITIPNLLLNWFPIIRTMILVMFDITLVYAVRKLLGGAS